MAAALGTPGTLSPEIFKINDEAITALAAADEVHSLEIGHIWAKCAIWQHNFHDPDSRRAENFWWHVWGSNRKKLPPRTLARLLNGIRESPTVVPLSKPSPLQSADNEGKQITRAAAGEELISPLLSPRMSSLGSFASVPSSCSSPSSAIVAGLGLGTPDKGKRPIRARGSLSPSAEGPSQPRSIFKKMEDAHASVARRHNVMSFSFSPIHLPENAIFEEDEEWDDDVSPLEPPPSLVAQAPEFVLCPAQGTYRDDDVRSRSSRSDAAPSDPGPTISGGIKDPRQTSSAGNAGPLVRVVGFGPFPKLPTHQGSDSRAHNKTSRAPHKSTSRSQPTSPPLPSILEETRPLLQSRRTWGDVPRHTESPVTTRSATLDRPENGPLRWPGAFSAETGRSQAQEGGSFADPESSASCVITLPEDLDRPPIPETYKRPKAVTLDCPTFGRRPFYLSSTLESRRITTIAHREVEKQLPPLPQAIESRGERSRGGPAGWPSRVTERPRPHDLDDAHGSAGVACSAAASRAARKTTFLIDDVLRGKQPKGAKSNCPSGGRLTETREGMTKTKATTTASRCHGRTPSPADEGREACHRAVSREGTTPTQQVFSDHSPEKSPEESRGALRGSGGSSSQLSLLLNQESGRR